MALSRKCLGKKNKIIEEEESIVSSGDSNLNSVK